MMRGHELRGTNPPYVINITAKTQFFRVAVLLVPEELMAKAEDLLHSLAPVMPLRTSSTVGGAYVSGQRGHGGKCLRLVKKETTITDLYNHYS